MCLRSDEPLAVRFEHVCWHVRRLEGQREERNEALGVGRVEGGRTNEGVEAVEVVGAGEVEAGDESEEGGESENGGEGRAAGVEGEEGRGEVERVGKGGDVGGKEGENGAVGGKGEGEESEEDGLESGGVSGRPESPGKSGGALFPRELRRGGRRGGRLRLLGSGTGGRSVDVVVVRVLRSRFARVVVAGVGEVLVGRDAVESPRLGAVARNSASALLEELDGELRTERSRRGGRERSSNLRVDKVPQVHVLGDCVHHRPNKLGVTFLVPALLLGLVLLLNSLVLLLNSLHKSPRRPGHFQRSFLERREEELEGVAAAVLEAVGKSLEVERPELAELGLEGEERVLHLAVLGLG